MQFQQAFFDSSQDHQRTKAVRTIDPQIVFSCNRGFPLYLPAENSVRCACPPAYFGNRCQYFSDRISIILHLNSSTLPPSLSTNRLAIVARLRFANTTIDHHIFHVHPFLELNAPIRHRFYLLYSRANTWLKHKRERYFNRTDLLHRHPYSVHFDIFALAENQTTELGSFHHPIYFDFLPAFRLATVLKFPSWFTNVTLNPCAGNPCNLNAHHSH